VARSTLDGWRVQPSSVAPFFIRARRNPGPLGSAIFGSLDSVFLTGGPFVTRQDALLKGSLGKISWVR